MKSKFTGLLRGLFRRFDGSEPTPAPSPRPVAFAAGASARTAPPANAPQLKPQPVHTSPAAAPGDLQLPLSSIIPALPMDLRAKLLIQTPPANAFVSIPVDKALSQLAHGSVRISFWELRAALPGLFDQSAEHDARQIVLPLKEIISRINPALLTRRAAKKIEASDDIAGPFTSRTPGAGSAPVQTPVKFAPNPPPPKTVGSARASTIPTPVVPPPLIVPKTMTFQTKPSLAVPAPAASAAVVPSAPVPYSPALASPASGLGNLQLPLSSIIPMLPMDLRANLLTQTPPANAFISIPVDKALSQLAHGSVRISFGELRAAFPRLFDHSSENDARQIVLPLKEIISQINPALLTRRAGKRIEAADEIAAPFSSRRHDAADQTPASSAPSPQPGAAPKSVTSPASPEPAAPAPAANLNFNTAPRIPISSPPIAGETTILAPLSALVEKWPDAIKMELVQANLMNAQAELPVSFVGPGLKRGRMTVPWKNLRMMVRPTPPPISVHDGVELELPLKVLAPLFFASQKAAGLAKQKTSVLADIPDLFQDTRKAEAAVPPAPAPASAPAPTPVATVPAKPDQQDVFSKTKATDDAGSEPEASGADFKLPTATPRDIVARALALPGVAGALIALYDGLKIASESPPDFNADTAAAFLPQIFDRVAHHTRELHMGALNRLEFTVGSVSWHIFRVNAIYFAAFSRAGEPLPSAQLASLADELDRRKE